MSFTREPGSDKTDQTKNIRAMDRYDMSKFNLQSACYFDGIRAGAAADAALVIATADVVYADGTFPAIVRAAGVGGTWYLLRALRHGSRARGASYCREIRAP